MQTYQPCLTSQDMDMRRLRLSCILWHEDIEDIVSPAYESCGAEGLGGFVCTWFHPTIVRMKWDPGSLEP